MDDVCIFDLAGIGIGPFNLGLAALCQTAGINAVFFEKSVAFNWHPGMLLSNARLQVPFYADLVTPVDPCNKFSYIAYLHHAKKFFRFAIRENYFVRRVDYNNYCRWVIEQLPNLHFNHDCQEIHFDELRKCFSVQTSGGMYYARQIVIGIGTTPCIPAFANNVHDTLTIHSGDYLTKKEELLQQKKITIVGSGQSAAEIVCDLLQSRYTGKLDWCTRSNGFFPMDYSKFALEKTSVDYINYFYSLPASVKSRVLKEHDNLYKGINAALLEEIYALLDDSVDASVQLYPDHELIAISPGGKLHFMQTNHEKKVTKDTDALILATGYKPSQPRFVTGISHLINVGSDGQFKVNRNYSIDDNNSIFVQNAEMHTHGHNAADLGLGSYRNATILNTILGYDRFELESGIAFQQFQ